MRRLLAPGVAVALAGAVAIPSPAPADPNIRLGFFTVYPQAVGTQLHDLPSHPFHCGVCHLDFDGGGPRNHYGLRVQNGLIAGLTNTQAVQAAASYDSDGDGIPNGLEITDVTHFGNTPTFPGLNQWNKLVTRHIPAGEIDPYITPVPGTDTTPPTVTVVSPNGGETLAAGATTTVSYTATDASGILFVNVYLSDDGGASWMPVAEAQSPTGSWTLNVPNLPGMLNRIRVEAADSAGVTGHDDSNSWFTITPRTGLVASTLRDVRVPGTQPLESTPFKEPALCSSCHAMLNSYKWEACWSNWLGSMVAQSARDPFFRAAVSIAEQDAPAIGDLCFRCHAPNAYENGRTLDTGGGQLTVRDRDGIHCDFCHRNVDPVYEAGVNPPEDVAVLAGLSDPPSELGNAGFVSDPNAARRGPLADALPSHQVLVSPFHHTGDACGLCHDSGNPLFEKTGPGDYALGTMNAQHSTRTLANMFPLGRTFSEWKASEYATTGVWAPQFAGNKPDGIVSTCQDCHMKDVTARGASQPNVVIRNDWPLHDFAGANTFVPLTLPAIYGAEVDNQSLSTVLGRARAMLQLAATLTLTPQSWGLDVRVRNETGHKLPTGTEGRRMWLHVTAVDGSGTKVFESGAYDATTATLTRDDQVRVWEYLPGLSPAMASQTGLTAGPSFHTVLNDTIYLDNRIPPRGFTNAAFEAAQAGPVGCTYADGEYWDDASFFLPATAETATVELRYQTCTREHAEFLRDANTTNTWGQTFYNAWANNGKSAPVTIATATIPLGAIITDVTPPATAFAWTMAPPRPTPFRDGTTLEFSLAEPAHVTVAVFDVAGRRVRTLVDADRDADRYRVTWDGRNDDGRLLGSGVYFVRYQAGPAEVVRRVVRLD